MRTVGKSSFSRLQLSLQSGFTLMEMLIVIGIVGLLSTLGVYSYNTAQRNARDVQRMSDLSAMQKGMESYYSETGTYTCSESILIQSGALPDGFPVDPKTQIGMEFLTYLREQLKPLASRQFIPQAYAQGSCSFCINNSNHQTQCTAQGGSSQFHLPCNSKVCCFLGSSAASPTPLPGGGGGSGSSTPSPDPGGSGGDGTGGTGGGSSSDPAAVQSNTQKYTLSRCTTSTYCACTRLERSGTGNASDRNCTWSTGGNFYCVQQSL